MRCIILIGLIAVVSSSINNVTTGKHKVTHKVWFDMNTGDVCLGRIVIGLFGRSMPITVKNFVVLATRPKGSGYIGSILHRIKKNEFISGGDYERGSGKRGRSSYETPMIEIENLNIKNYGIGWVASEAAGTFHTSFFIITLKRLPNLDGISPVFGKVLKGINVVRTISGVPVDDLLKPIEKVFISDCGTEIVDPPFFVDRTDAYE